MTINANPATDKQEIKITPSTCELSGGASGVASQTQITYNLLFCYQNPTQFTARITFSLLM